VSGAGRRRRWWRWTLAGVVLLAVIVVGGAAIFVKSQPSAAPLALPSGTASPPAGLVDGTWDVATGSVAGFRIRESALGFGSDVTGRTTAVTDQRLPLVRDNHDRAGRVLDDLAAH